MTISKGVQFVITQRLMKVCGGLDGIEDLMTGRSETLQLPVYSHLSCANSGVSHSGESCANPGSLSCSKCRLVKYCGKACQVAHWPSHRRDCKHPQLKAEWQPVWINENRQPSFIERGPQDEYKGNKKATYLWGDVPAIDCLNATSNEGPDARTTDFKLCFAASGDIRNLVRTINCLPNDYTGKCDVLLNVPNLVIANRILVILYALLGPEYPIPGAVELATHLMYSSALSDISNAHFNRCISIIYGQGLFDGQRGVINASLPIRGKGTLYTMQAVGDLEEPLGMFLSTYKLPEALKNMQSVMLDPDRVDYRDHRMATLTPGHRMAHTHFAQSGVLAPYSADTSHFTEPNRLLFTGDGEWLTFEDANPLQGWDIASVYASGKRHGIDSTDIYGCLLFHVKNEFEEFARRIERFHINIHMTQLDIKKLPKMISKGYIEPFGSSCFDRVETSSMPDYIGSGEVIDMWGPLLNRHNKHATLLMYFMNWHRKQPGGGRETAATEKVYDTMLKTVSVLDLGIEDIIMDKMIGTYSANFVRVIAHFDIFHDNSGPFDQFLRDNNTEKMARSYGLRLRPKNTIQTRRLGIPLNRQDLKVPELTGEECYEIFIVGRGDAPMRFVEFEVAS